MIQLAKYVNKQTHNGWGMCSSCLHYADYVWAFSSSLQGEMLCLHLVLKLNDVCETGLPESC